MRLSDAPKARQDAGQQPAAGNPFADAKDQLERLLREMGLQSGDRVAVRLLSSLKDDRPEMQLSQLTNPQQGTGPKPVSGGGGGNAREHVGASVSLARHLAELSEVRRWSQPSFVSQNGDSAPGDFCSCCVDISNVGVSIGPGNSGIDQVCVLSATQPALNISQEQPAAFDAAALAHDLGAPLPDPAADHAHGSGQLCNGADGAKAAPLQPPLPPHLNILLVLARLKLPDGGTEDAAADGSADAPQQGGQREYELRRHVSDGLADVLLCAPELLGGEEQPSGQSIGIINGGDDVAAGEAPQDARSLDARLLLFQLLSALAAVHSGGGSLGDLQPEDVLLHDRQCVSASSLITWAATWEMAICISVGSLSFSTF